MVGGEATSASSESSMFGRGGELKKVFSAVGLSKMYWFLSEMQLTTRQ